MSAGMKQLRKQIRTCNINIKTVKNKNLTPSTGVSAANVKYPGPIINPVLNVSSKIEQQGYIDINIIVGENGYIISGTPIYNNDRPFSLSGLGEPYISGKEEHFSFSEIKDLMKWLEENIALTSDKRKFLNKL